jgi:hypothetical protein
MEIYLQEILASDVDESTWLASRYDCFTLWETASAKWKWSRSRLYGKEKILCLPGTEPWPDLSILG